MALIRFLFLSALLPAIAAGVGAVAARPIGGPTLFVVATVAGTFGVLATLRWLVSRGWFRPERQRGGAIGGLVGLGLGVPIAAMSPGDPIALTVGALLIGIGTIVGAGPGAAQ